LRTGNYGTTISTSTTVGAGLAVEQELKLKSKIRARSKQGCGSVTIITDLDPTYKIITDPDPFLIITK